MTTDVYLKIKTVLKTSLRNKFAKYNPETKHMPFHTYLLGKDRMALFSFIQSLNTTFGVSVFEPVAIVLAEPYFKYAKTRVDVYEFISEGAEREIQSIMDRLLTAERDPDRTQELEMLRKVCRTGKLKKKKLTKVDIWLQSENDELFLIDMKTTKPNIGGFKEFKRTLLEWTAAELAKNQDAKVHAIIGIPYNPYEPKPYARWTIRGMLDISQELLVAEELWDFLGGNGTYNKLLKCFEEVGIELRSEIDEYFTRFK